MNYNKIQLEGYPIAAWVHLLREASCIDGVRQIRLLAALSPLEGE